MRHLSSMNREQGRRLRGPYQAEVLWVDSGLKKVLPGSRRGHRVPGLCYLIVPVHPWMLPQLLDGGPAKKTCQAQGSE